MGTCFIYGLKDPNTLEIRYIGMTSSGMKRPEAHSTKSHLNRKSHRSSWIKSLNGLKPIIAILEICDKRSLKENEIKWIKKAKELGWNLTNHTSGGEGIFEYVHTEESKRKISEASKMMWKTNPRVLTDEARYACGNSTRGKTVKDEIRLKIAKSFGAPTFNVYDKITGELLGTFNSISECSRVLGEFRKTISWSLFKDKHVSKRFRFERVS